MTNTVKLSTGPALINTTYAKNYPFKVSRMEIETLDWSVSLVTRSWGRDTRAREYFAKTRVYEAQEAFVPGFLDEEMRLFKAIPDHSVKDPALAKFLRAANKKARVGILETLPQLFEVLRADGRRVPERNDLDAKFSMRAGCSMCSCSPGFVVSERLSFDGEGYDVWFR